MVLRTCSSDVSIRLVPSACSQENGCSVASTRTSYMTPLKRPFPPTRPSLDGTHAAVDSAQNMKKHEMLLFPSRLIKMTRSPPLLRPRAPPSALSPVVLVLVVVPEITCSSTSCTAITESERALRSLCLSSSRTTATTVRRDGIWTCLTTALRSFDQTVSPLCTYHGLF